MPFANTIFHLGNKAISLISGLLASSMILYSSYVLYDTMYTQQAAFSSGWDLLQYKPEIIEDGEMPLNEMGLGMLVSINDDTAAWITIDDTHIDYPVLQGENDLYYASHDLYNESSLTGAIYLSCQNSKDFSDSYNMIYGHHMDNGAMFGDIDHFVNAEYFEDHKAGTLILRDGTVYDLTIFACVSTDAYENAVYSVGNRDLGKVLTYAKAHALQYTEGIGENASKICVLSTCAAGETNGRLVLYAAMDLRSEGSPAREKDEKPVAGIVDPADPDDPDDFGGSDDPDGNDGFGEGDADIEEDTEIEEIDENFAPAAFGGIDQNGPGAGSGEIFEEIEENETPLVNFFDKFTPTGGSHGKKAWALVNLICLAVTCYLVLPVMHIRAKFSRSKKMRKVNEAAGCDYYEQEKFSRRFQLGILLEVADLILAAIAFLMTENLSLPMTIIDRWTPLMILLLGLGLVIDLRLVQYREDDPETVFIEYPSNGGTAPQPAK